MFLKQIELQGFKSFANNTVLNFEKGITGIVGPNGSGKSNIADAVRWVLGEQKVKQLRGSSMQDVIFAGTENRKAQGFAYVSLVIDNKDRKLNLDYDEVQVSRRLYKSGDSEYKLNNVDCRLRDINELFYDTGIGKEGYSIIGQGQIDKIISSKPEDKRELFDEASGIVKYKRRKAVAEKKLEEEKLNVSRASDIINELEKQVGPLARQAETAKKYQVLYQDLLSYEVSNFVKIIDRENEKQVEGNSNLEIYENQLEEAQRKKEEFTEKYNEMDKKISNLDTDVADLRVSESDKKALREKINGQINVIQEQINNELASKTLTKERIEKLNDEIFKNIEDIENQLGVLLSLKKQIEFIKDNNESVTDDDAVIDEDLQKINKIIEDCKENVYKVMGEDYNLDLSISESKDLVFDDDVFKELNDKRKEVEEVERNIEDKKEDQRLLSNKLEEQNQKLKILSDKILDNQNFFHSQESKLETIKNMLERYEGYGNVCKSIMDEKDRFGGIKGVVADIFETEEKYEVAIETALGNSIQNIVTEDVDTAKRIFNFLNENKLGRITLLPLTSIVPKEDEIYNKYKNEVGVIGQAIELVKYSEEFEKLAKYLLSRCLVIDTFENAKNIFEKSHSQMKLVTLNGELFNPGGALTGGKYKNQSNLLGRKREFEELKLQIEETKNKIDAQNVEKQSLSEDCDKTYNEIENIKSAINTLMIDRNTKILNIVSNMKLKYNHIQEKANYVNDDMNRLIKSLEDTFYEKETLGVETSNSQSIISQKQKEIDNFTNQVIEITNDLDNIAKQIVEKDTEKTNLLSNRSEFFKRRDDLSNELTSLNNEIYITKANLEKSINLISDTTNYMFSEYNLTYNEVKEKYNILDETETNLKKLIKEQKKAIQDLGPINLEALEQYKQVSDRYELLTGQYNDLMSSQSEIEKIVEDLDREMREKFEESFKNIKIEFERVFKELFGGGHATLELIETNENDILDAGVDIRVQPPGKKLGNMMQLSGGEKALTAIALLFAIQNLKPSPFCLLDEIEAALDESNVDRFADYLHKLTNETQFILITHRRGTMEKADRLYGITMQEKGITTLVSVNLVQDEIKN